MKIFYSAIVMVCLNLSVFGQFKEIFHEKFNNNNFGWYDMEDDNVTIRVLNQKYYLKTPEGGYMTHISIPVIDNTKDFSIQATFTQLDGAENNSLGFLWGYDRESKHVFSFTTNGYFRINSPEEKAGKVNEWIETDLINPLGEENILKVIQRGDKTYFYINGTEVYVAPIKMEWYGSRMGFVSYTNMRFLVDDFILTNDVSINLPKEVQMDIEKRNMGFLVNSEYDDLSPKISSDGKVLYFGRKKSPENIGGIEDAEDIWYTSTSDGINWKISKNMGTPLNTEKVNNLISVSTDNNTFLFHKNKGFAFVHRTEDGWSEYEDIGVRFENNSVYLEGCLSPDGKAILFTANLEDNISLRDDDQERDIYVCLKKRDGSWSKPFNAGSDLNSFGDEYSPFISADGKTLFFATDGRPGYGGVDIFMSRRLDDTWKSWSEPVNMGPGINTHGFDAYYTIPASGEYGYMTSNVNSIGKTDIVQFKLPQSLKPDPVVLIHGRVLNAKTREPLSATILFDDLKSGNEMGEARSDPHTGNYQIALPFGFNYGYHASLKGFLSVNENLELSSLNAYSELEKDLLLVPIEIGETIQLNNVFFERAQAKLKTESYPELDRLILILKDNPTIEIELSGHTDNRGNPNANKKLSQERVDAVTSYLVGKGIEASRIKGKGYGGDQPLFPNINEKNREMNRRVEFKITKK
ncbi:MAG: OmpA family protein [Cyclobacteriaceae bacterium]|nr:OmpA family protein [Cyclobacteriaceae bacterium]